ncbi:hypothetical protein [Burkholderia gladioli]|uniref:hypothetical protein n=1 Tax=Burkholderia gladioli TaxID=28095 RepID=UPI0034DB2D86
MMTLRLEEELEAQLDSHCRKYGIKKTAAVTEAVRQHLASPDVTKLELAETLDEPEDPEARYERRRARLQEQYEKEVVIAGWIAERVIWTKKPDPSGDITPGVYGRNTVVGFSDTMWLPDGTAQEGVFVIAEHHPGRPAGIQAHHRYVCSFEVWLKHMRIVPRV